MGRLILSVVAWKFVIQFTGFLLFLKQRTFMVAISNLIKTQYLNVFYTRGKFIVCKNVQILYNQFVYDIFLRNSTRKIFIYLNIKNILLQLPYSIFCQICLKTIPCVAILLRFHDRCSSCWKSIIFVSVCWFVIRKKAGCDNVRFCGFLIRIKR